MRLEFNSPFTLVATLFFSALFIFIVYYTFHVKGSSCPACR